MWHWRCRGKLLRTEKDMRFTYLYMFVCEDFLNWDLIFTNDTYLCLCIHLYTYNILCIIIRLYDIQNHYRWNTASRIITTGNPLKPSTNPSKLPSRTELRLSKRAGKKHAVRGIDIAKVKRKERRCLFVFPLGRGKIPLYWEFLKMISIPLFLSFPTFFFGKVLPPQKN